MGTKACLKISALLLAGLWLAGCDSGPQKRGGIANNTPAPSFPSGNAGGVANTAQPSSFGGTSGGYKTTQPTTGGGFPTTQPTTGGGFPTTQPTSGFSNPPSSNPFPSTAAPNAFPPTTPMSSGGSFGTGTSSIPPVNTSGPGLPSTPSSPPAFGR